MPEEELRVVPDEVRVGKASLTDDDGVGDAVVLRLVVFGDDGAEAYVDVGFDPPFARRVALLMLEQVGDLTPLEPQYDYVRLSGLVPPEGLKSRAVLAELATEMFELGPADPDEFDRHLTEDHGVRRLGPEYGADDRRTLHRMLHAQAKETDEADRGQEGDAPRGGAGADDPDR